MSARFLVTGGTGFIGRRLVAALAARHGASSVVCLIAPAASPAEAAALDALRAAGVRLLPSDLLGSPVCAEPAPKVEAVFHLAASLDLGAPESRLRVNDEGTRNLLAWLGGAARGGRVNYVSSVAVHDRVAHPTAPIDEKSPFTPRTAYGVTKLRGEELLRAGAEPGGYSWTVFRLPTVYGPGQRDGGLFSTMLKLAPANALLARLDWPGRTSVIHVDDVVEALVALSSLPEAAGQAYCVSSDEHPTVGEIARTIAKVSGGALSPISIPGPLLALMRAAAWSPLLRTCAPASARLAAWRVSLMVSDGFWFDPSKFRAVYRKPMRALEDGLRELAVTR
ncbi:MAG: NAD(P)-dependent oxidoreductase [Elusimicrobia bacterium]|nr:NAD(P)-dependent oxidoreductase [Elusimicrobiota bacterium]